MERGCLTIRFWGNMKKERNGIMIAQKTTGKIVKETPATSSMFWCLVVAVFLTIIGGGIPAAFWGIWGIFAPIPKFLGYSRLWQDVVSGIVWTVIIAVYMNRISETSDDLSRQYNRHNAYCDGDEYEVSFKEAFWNSILLAITAIIGAVILVATAIFLSLAAGLAIFAFMWLIVLIGWSVWDCFILPIIEFVIDLWLDLFAPGS